MTELNPARLLIVVGALAVILPWLLHWDTTTHGYVSPGSAYLSVIYCSLVTGLISTFGSLYLLSRNSDGKHLIGELLGAFFLGSSGLYSLFFVIMLSMM